MLQPSRVSRGKNSQAWRRVMARPSRPRAGRDLPGGEHQHAVADVGVVAFLVGIGVVAVVFTDPPAVAQADPQVAQDPPESIVGATAGEDLLVSAVMAEEGDLGERDTQHRGGEGLKPRGTDPRDARPGRAV
jgi:hypothetical protein